MKKISTTSVDQTSTISARVLQAAYSHYGNTAYVSSGDGKVTPQNIKRVFAAALLSTASVVAVGAATSTSAMAGVCNQTGQTINCGGAFTDTIEYNVVEDLTLVLGDGGIVDTTGNYSEFSGDNMGMHLYSDDDATVINRGGVYTGDDGAEYSEDTYGNHGIFAESWNDDATAINAVSGTILTQGDYGHGALAETKYGDATATNDGLISTIGEGSDAVRATVDGGSEGSYDATATNSSTGTIFTDGTESDGVVAVSNAEYGSASASNAGSITTYGSYSTGVFARGYYADATNSGTISMEGYASVGVYASGYSGGEYSDGVTATNTEDGTITIDADASAGVVAYGYGDEGIVTASNAGNISITGNAGTEGAFDAATWLAEDGPDLTAGIEAGEGDASDYVVVGVGAFGGDIAYAFNHAATEDVPGSGTISVTGVTAIGLSANGDEAYAYNDGTITSGSTEGGFANFGILANAQEDDAGVYNSGTVDTYGTLSMGALAWAPDESATATNYAGGSITTHDAWDGEDNSSFGAVGLGAYSGDSNATAINGGLTEAQYYSEDTPPTATITTHGDAAFGVVAVSVVGGYYNSEDESWSGGAYAHNTTYGSVTTYGDLAIGVLASTLSDKYAHAVNDGSITTNGYGAFGVAALGGNMGVTWATEDGVVEAVFDPISGNSLATVPPYMSEYDGFVYAVNSEDGTITTHGVAGAGVYAGAIYADATGVNRGSVTTSEDLGAGVVAASVFGDARAANLYNGSITTSGDDAVGVFAISGNTVAGYGEDITPAEGDGAYAINSGYDKYNNSEYSFEDVGRATVRTYGDDAVGVLAMSYGSTAWALNVQGDVTTGSAIIPDGPVSTGQGASGVMARAFDGDALASNKYYSDVTTYGDDAYGVAAFAVGFDADALAINAKYSTVETFGDGSTGVLAVSEDDAVAMSWLGSDVTTHGDDAGGVVAYSTEGDATAVNGSYVGYLISAPKYASYAPSTITTYGEDSVGLSATTEDGDAFAVNGDGSSITTYGENSDGLVASANYGTAYAVNGFHSFSEDGDGSTSSITTIGDFSYGMLVSSTGETYFSEDSNVEAVNYGSITTSGIDSDGIHAYSEDGDVTVTNASTGVITTGAPSVEELFLTEDGGYRAFGIYAWAVNGDVEITNDGSVTTNGEDAIGIYGWTTNSGDITISNSEDASVTTYGDGATGIFAYAEGSGSIDITNDGSVSTGGDDADGIYAYAQSDTVTVYNTGTIETTGEDSIGIAVHNNGEGNTYITNTSTGEITTSGANADGIDVNSEEDGDVFVTNAGTITVTGEDAIGIDVDSYYAATVINTGTISSEDVAVSIYSGYGDDSGGPSILRNEDGGAITGDVEIGAYYDARFYNVSSTITGAVFLDSNEGDVYGSVSGSGNDITQGIHAIGSGVLAFDLSGEDPTMTFADGVEGNALSGFDRISFNSGTVTFDNGGDDDVVDIAMNEGGIITIGDAVIPFTSEDVPDYATVIFKGGDGSTIDVDAAHTYVGSNGTLSIETATNVDFTGDVEFEDGSTFRTQLENTGEDISSGILYASEIYFTDGSNIYLDVVNSIDAYVGDKILIARADSEDGITDNGSNMTGNYSILFHGTKVIDDTEIVNNEDGVTYTGQSLYVVFNVDTTAYDVSSEDGGSANDDDMAKAIDEYIETHPLDDPLVQYLLQFETEEDQRAALLKLVQDTLPDESNGGVAGTIGASDLVFDMILDRLANGGFFVAANDTQSGVSAGDMALGGDGHWALWGRAGLLKAEYTPSAVPGFDADTWGISVGIDGSVAENVRVGLAYMYQDAKIDETGVGANSDTEITGHGIIGYMSYTPDPYFLNAALSYTMNKYDGSRITGLGTNTSDYDGAQVAARAELGRVFKEGSFDLTPSVGLRYNYVSQDAYTETGLLALHVDERNETSVRGTLGLNAKYNMELSGGGKLIPEASVSLINEFADPNGAIAGNVVGGGSFITTQTARDDLSYGVGAGLTYKATDSLSMGIHYQGEFQSDYSQNAGEFNIRLAF